MHFELSVDELDPEDDGFDDEDDTDQGNFGDWTHGGDCDAGDGGDDLILHTTSAHTETTRRKALPQWLLPVAPPPV